jgi:hypothetical protein
MSKIVAIVQSNYIPWKGYFDLIGCADEFVLYDHVQFTNRDWRNRNKIKTIQGMAWLTIPVLQKGRKFSQSVEEAITASTIWRKKHWKTLEKNYLKASYFDLYANELKKLYLEEMDESLSLINHKFIRTICRFLGINTRLSFSHEYDLPGGRTENLVAICKQLGATEYLTGPSAKNYLKESMFEEQGIRVHYADYSGYREYDQRYRPFEHSVSILDLLFCQGPNATSYMKFPLKGL